MANDINNTIFETLFNEYEKTSSFAQSRIRQDRVSEDATCNDYRGRELYELLQNAEDEQSEFVNIILDSQNKSLKVQNGGDKCKPFSEAGFCSIMMSGMSPKRVAKERKQYIGNKGLGFRSILNWADEVSIVSAGVKCSFSLKIAHEKWNKIKVNFTPELIAEHESFSEKEFKTPCPLAILAIPEVIKPFEYKDFTTSIEITYKESSFDNIKKQIESLSGKVLLFLKNIKKISITVNDKSYEIKKEEEIIDKDGFIEITTYDIQHSEGQKWIVWLKEHDFQNNEKYEIGIAYDLCNHESGEYIYSFFPTQIRIPLPCVIHATFELTSSRNDIIQSEANNVIKKQIANMLLEFAEHMAKRASASPTWEFHDILTMKDNHDLADLKEILAREKEEKRIYPTLRAGYVSLNGSCHYSDVWADFVDHNLHDQFPCHLLKGFEERGIERQPIDPVFFDKVNEYSKQLENKDQQFENRCDLICAVQTIPAGKEPKLQLLVDESGKLISGEAHMNVGESISYLPAAINISYVNTSLAVQLIDRLEINEFNAMRGLTRMLKAYTSVTDMDVSQAKRKIVSYTKTNMESDDDYTQLLFALFSKYTESEKGPDYVKEIASNPEFNLLDIDGNKHYPSELVLVTSNIQSYPNKFLLSGTFDEWKQIFSRYTSLFNSQKSNISDDVIKDFFYLALGVSSIVPMVCIPIDENANDYISRYASSYTIVNKSAAYYTKELGDEHNRYKVISEEFCNSYINSHSLLDLIKLIIGNDELFEELNNRQLHYRRYRSIKSETARISYAQYIMSKYNCFKDIHSFVVSENLYFGENRDVGNALQAIVATPSENAMTPYADRLIFFGAKKDLSTIPVEELFKILLYLPDRNLAQGIQKIYRALREALKKHEETELFRKQCAEFKAKGKVYARVGSNIEARPVKDVYYWDNDQLPKHILAKLPKLEIGSRVGEDSVKAIFGVNLTKDIEICLNSESQEDKELSDALNKYFRERLRYLLSYRILNTKENANAIKTYSNHLKNTKFKVYTKCAFNYNGESVELKIGDMISSKTEQDTIFHICTGHTVFTSAIKDPKFCENITEAICIVLQVTGSEITNCFRSIINQPIEYTKFISEKDISKEDWDNADKALGVSEQEKTFWGKVFNLAGKTINLDKLSMLASDKLEYLRENFPDIELPTPLKDVDDMKPAEKYRLALSLRDIKGFNARVFGDDTMLKDYYSLWLKEDLLGLEQKFKSWAYMHIDELKGNEQQLPPYRFYNACMEFVKGEWAKTIVSEEKILDNDGLNEKLIKLAQKAYPSFSPQSQESVHLEIRQEYKEILNEHKLTPDNIDYKDIYLTYFKGEQYLDMFREIVENCIKQIDGEEVSDQENVSAVISYGEAQTIKPSDSKNGAQSGGRYKTDRELKRIGLNAEKLVFETMNNNKGKFKDVKGCSRNTESITGDSNHYDIQYKKTGENEVRYLEVKVISQDSIIMSKAEYDFAIEHKERYDFALVRNNQITIVETPFLQSGNHQALEVFPESYKVPLKIIKKN